MRSTLFYSIALSFLCINASAFVATDSVTNEVQGKISVTEIKAPRLDEPSVIASDAIVGKDGCDLTIVVSLLSVIKKRIIRLQEILCRKIEDIDRDIVDTKTVLCEKFEQTWTILADIDDGHFITQTIV